MDRPCKPDDGVFLTQDDNDDIFPQMDHMDPRESMRLEKVRQAKKQIDFEAEQYQEEVKKMQDEIK